MTLARGVATPLFLVIALPWTLAAQAVQRVVAEADSDERLVGATVALVPVAPDSPDLGEVNSEGSSKVPTLASLGPDLHVMSMPNTRGSQ